MSRAVYVWGEVGGAAGAQPAQAAVNHEKNGEGDQDGPHQDILLILVGVVALALHAAQEHTGADEAGGDVAGVIGGEHGVGKGILHIAAGGGADGDDEDHRHNDEQGDEQDGSGVGADHIHHLGAVAGKEVGQGEEGSQEHNIGPVGQIGGDAPHASLGRHSAAAGNGAEEDDEDADDAEQLVPPGVDVVGQVIEVGAHVHHSVHGQHGKDDARQGHACDAPDHVLASADADGRGENQVARAEEDGEHGETKYEDVFCRALFHTLSLFLTLVTHTLMSQRPFSHPHRWR